MESVHVVWPHLGLLFRTALRLDTAKRAGFDRGAPISVSE